MLSLIFFYYRIQVLELKHLHSERKYAAKCIDKKKLDTIENGMV